MPRINEYPETTTPNNTDLFIVQTSEGTKKITYQTLKQIVLGGNQNGSN